jgi:tetrahydromethanopterin S-methyltransferase subunit G
MEKIVEQLINAENWRTLAVLVVVLYGYLKLNMSFEKKFGFLNKRIDDVELSLNKKIDCVEASLGKRIDALDKKVDGVESSLLKAMDEKIDTKLAMFYAQLKANDFAHLNNTIEALTFTLEKNNFLKREDKEYIDSRLDR